MDDPIIDMQAMSRSWPAGPVAESHADRRERIAEAMYVMLMGQCAAGNMHWSMDLCAEKAREWADSFVTSTPKQPTTAELDDVCADLREAIELLRAFRRDRHTIADWEPIWYQADALLEKHKEKP